MKNALIIGASRGIGLELVRQYRAEGIAVTATARDDAGLARLAELGAKALRLDVATAAGCSGCSPPPRLSACPAVPRPSLPPRRRLR